MNPLSAVIALAFGGACLIAFFGMKSAAEAARGQRRYLAIGFYRSVLLALGIVSLMIGISRVLSIFTA